MKKLSFLIIALLACASLKAQTTWKIDKVHSSIGFSVTHMAVSETEGNFKDFDATVVSNTDDFDGATVEFTAKVASIDTDNERRDGHLKSDDFFSAEKFPEITFKGKLVKKDAKKYMLEGDFTMKGVTKKVSFETTYGGKIDTGRGVKSGFKVKGTVNRQEYGLTWNNTVGGELAVGNEVTIECKVELDKS